MMLVAILGGVMVAAGLGGLGWCIAQGFAIRREGAAPEVARARLQRLVAVNLGSVGLAALGLGVLVIGLTLG